MKKYYLFSGFKNATLSIAVLFYSLTSYSQTNVYDDVIATSPNHTSLLAAINTAGLQSALQNPSANLTVFAPDNNAFDDLAAQLNTNISGLLGLSNLSDILLYHVLGVTADAASITNGQLVTPLNTSNSIKLTKTSTGDVYANQAMVNGADLTTDNGIVHSVDAVLLPNQTVADVALGSTDHTYLVAAVIQEELLPALTDPFAEYTVFAPDNNAFDDLATALNTNIAGLLALPNLSDILLYHVLGVTADAASVTNGQIVTPLNTSNSIKLTKTSTGDVYANQAMVNGADLTAENGIVHSLDAVLLPNQTVADVVLGSTNHTYLLTAVIQEELLPALTDPFAEYTVFAPDNNAFDDLATALNTNIAGLLALPNLSDILLYHVLGVTADAASVTNGQIVTPLNTSNSIKLTKTSTGDVYANQAMVNGADLTAENGIVHSLDAVILPNQTVVDVALGSTDHTYLVTALIQEELLPALTDPLSKFTVFAPDNNAFDDLATELGTNIAGVLATPNLSDILLYHVTNSELLSGDLTNGPITMLNLGTINVDVSNGVMVNSSTVTTPNLTSENGVVHVIDKVLIESTASVSSNEFDLIEIFPNPSSDYVTIRGTEGNFNSISIIDAQGKNVLNATLNSNLTTIDISALNKGLYTIKFEGSNSIVTRSFLISSNK